MIILISGYKRSGKDTIADYLVQKYGFTRYGFADPIKETVKYLFDWNDDWINNNKETIDERWGISYRQAAQWLGTEAFQYSICEKYPLFKETIGRSFWVKKFENLYNNKENNYVLSDYRFPHEYELLKHLNPICIKVERDGCEFDGHESESYIETLHYNHIIENNTLLPALYFKIDGIMKKIRY